MLDKIFKTDAGRYSSTMWVNMVVVAALAVLSVYGGDLISYIENHPEWGVWGAMAISAINMVLRHRTSESMAWRSKEGGGGDDS